MSGTYEGVARGVPFLLSPLFADQVGEKMIIFRLFFLFFILFSISLQFRNAQSIVNIGNGLRLPFNQITVETLSSHLNELLTNKSYYNRAKEISRLFNDNLAMFWIEYVI